MKPFLYIWNTWILLMPQSCPYILLCHWHSHIFLLVKCFQYYLYDHKTLLSFFSSFSSISFRNMLKNLHFRFENGITQFVIWFWDHLLKKVNLVWRRSHFHIYVKSVFSFFLHLFGYLWGRFQLLFRLKVVYLFHCSVFFCTLGDIYKIQTCYTLTLHPPFW